MTANKTKATAVKTTAARKLKAKPPEAAPNAADPTPEPLKPGDRVRFNLSCFGAWREAVGVVQPDHPIEGTVRLHFSFFLPPKAEIDPMYHADYPKDGLMAGYVQIPNNKILEIISAEQETTSLVAAPQQSDSVTDLDTSIAQLHTQAIEAETTAKKAGQAAAQLYYDLGALLLRRRESLGYGEWLPYLATVGIEERRAQRSMQIARRFGECPPNLQGLTLHEALNESKRVTVPSPLPPSPAPTAPASLNPGDTVYLSQMAGTVLKVEDDGSSLTVKMADGEYRTLTPDRLSTQPPPIGGTRHCRHCQFADSTNSGIYCQKYKQDYQSTENPAPNCESYKPGYSNPRSVEVKLEDRLTTLQAKFEAKQQTAQAVEAQAQADRSDALSAELETLEEWLSPPEVARSLAHAQSAIDKLGAAAVGIMAIEAADSDTLLQLLEVVQGAIAQLEESA